MSEECTRVFILESSALVRRGLVDLLAATPDLRVVGYATTGEEAMPLIALSNPRVVVLSGRLVDGGVEVGRQVRSAHPDVRCLLLTSFDDDEALLAAVLAGAAGYLVKQIGGTRLADGVRAVAGGHSLLDRDGTARLLDRLRQPGPGSASGATMDDREHEVLRLVSQGSTDRQIAEAVGTSLAEVRGLVHAIYDKHALRGQGLRAAAVLQEPTRPTGHAR